MGQGRPPVQVSPPIASRNVRLTGRATWLDRQPAELQERRQGEAMRRYDTIGQVAAKAGFVLSDGTGTITGR